MKPTPDVRPLFAAPAVFLGVAFLAFGGLFLFSAPESLTTLFYDDAFYYYGVARNVAAGAGFTFDGLHRTNGFHPLWLLGLVPLFGLGLGDTGVLRLIILIQIALIGAAMVLMWRILRSRIGERGALLAPLLLTILPGAHRGLAGGMESALLLLLLVAAWGLWLRARAGNGKAERRVWLALGSCCAAAFLTRLEAGLLLPVCLLMALGVWLRRPSLLAWFLAPSTAAGAGYLLWNRLAFGTWLPVSAQVKAAWASKLTIPSRVLDLADIPWVGQDVLVRAFGQHPLFSESWRLPVLNLLLALTIAVAWRWRRRLREFVQRSQCTFLIAMALAWIAANKITIAYLERWNRVPIHLATAVFVAALVSQRPVLARGLAIVVIVTMLIQAPWTLLRASDSPDAYGPYRYRAALWLKERTSGDDRIGSWNAGTLGYFSHRSVVNLDGLVNDTVYLEQVIKGSRLGPYLDREGIRWLADQACGPEPRPTLYMARTGNAHLDRDWSLVAQFQRGAGADGCPGYAVWQRSPVEDSPYRAVR